MTKQLKALLVAIIILGIVLFTALALATRNTASFAYNYTTLFYLNIAVIFVMSALLIFLGYWLYLRLRSNVFGTRLLTRFALSFVILAVVPSVLLVVISNVFVSRTINSWFNLKLESALTAGIDFGRDRLLLNRDITQEQLALWVSQNSGVGTPNEPSVQATLKKNNWRSLIGLDAQGRVTWRVDAAGVTPAQVNTHLPQFAPDWLNPIEREWVQIEDETDQADIPANTAANAVPRQFIHVIQTLPHNSGATRWVYAQKIMPETFSARVNDIQNGLRDYQATETARSSLSQLYQVTLMIILLITLLAALAAAFLIANRMIQPILWLAQATRQVAAGHYALVPQRVKGSDEMLQLVDSFGDMAQQLNITQTSLARNQHQLESAKAYSEAVLDNLSSSVLVLNQNLHLLSFNQTAVRMFQTDLTHYTQQALRNIEAFAPLVDLIEMQIKHAQESTQYSWRVQHPFTHTEGGQGEEMILSIQGSRFLADNDSYNWILVCDDVTPIISAQRTLAWGEVARRLAHEIKNPLTPIQLSAERLSMKLSDKLDDEGKIQLERSTRTIINQVSALQNMVNEFRDYARTPAAVFAAVDLNALIDEIMVLYESGQNQNYLISTQLAQNLPDLWADEQQLRQVLHNLVKNAIEAHTPSEAAPLATLDISTECLTLQANSLVPTHAVRLIIRDNGSGFPESVLARMFEPYNSNKVHGTGLGLPIVKKIMDAHHAQISVKNLSEKNQPQKIIGAQIGILFLNVMNEDSNTGTGQLL